MWMACLFQFRPVIITGDDSGFAIVMGRMPSHQVERGQVHVYVGSITGVLYPDDDDEAYASATFAPTYFGSEYVTGDTDFTLTYHLPPNMNPEEPRWHEAPDGFPSEPQAGYDSNNRVTYTWYSPTAQRIGFLFVRLLLPAHLCSR